MSEAAARVFGIQENWWQIIVRGIITFLFGLLLLVWPGASLFILTIFFGVFVLLDGIFSLVHAAKHKLGAGTRTWLIIRGIVGIIVGLITFIWPAITEVVLILLIGAWALVAGIFEIIFAATSKAPGSARWLFAISGVLSVILGILLLARPIAGLLAIIWAIGAFAIVMGILLIIVGARLRCSKAGNI